MMLILGAVVAACSTGEEAAQPAATVAATSSTTSTSAATATTMAETTTTAIDTTTTVPKLPPVEIQAADYLFEGFPESLPVGTRLSLFNTSSTEFHEMVIYRLDPSEQRTVAELSQLPLDELTAYGVGRIQSVVFAMPESEQYSYADGPPVLAEEGRYLIFCSIDGVPRHYQVGMMTEIISTG